MLLEELKQRLVTAGLSSIFLGDMPDAPDECIVLYETQGLPAEFGIGSAEINYETPGLQVVARGPRPDFNVTTTYTSPRTRLEQVQRELARVSAVTLTSAGSPGTSAFYHWIRPMSGIINYKRDNEKRVYLSANFLIEKEPSS